MKISIGTRKSKLALWQAEFVADQLRSAGASVELVTMETKGDKKLDVSISKIGSKGVFTEELEEKLANGEIDIAVHSAKDMQSSLPEGFQIIAFSEREQANDVLISDQSVNLDKEGLVVGTSSTRRVATLRHYYPHIKIVDMRGNLQTRIQKMRDGACDALILAYAGVHRMGYHDMIQQHLPLDKFTPAVGQGSVAIEVNQNLAADKIAFVRDTLNHESTEQILRAERSYLRRLDGGCSIPVFGLARHEAGAIQMSGGIISLDGQQKIDLQQSGNDPEKLGVALAEEVLAAGGDQILREIKDSL
ncbi:MAG: hydroxymethylbilane synthase [Cytophagales bacterium]|nr:hydroxymethylbilane synthase [Cytophagales bacterium]